ncbi:MAG: hypothetical protein GF368_01150 [Candidatus Aenigmarchaeota archaeon]|nr:hypothetical protein [Candidatus Aenigmarchaeota archaeon]
MRKISWNKYFSVFLLTLFIFIIGFLIAQRISSRTSIQVTETQKELRNYILSLNLQSEIASEYICKVNVFQLTKEKSELGKRIDVLEKNLGKDHKIVEDLKQDYSLLSLRQWLLVKKVKEECDRSINIIIFFYSNKLNSSESESQGYVLDYIYEKYPDDVVIYAFDIDEENPALKTLKDIYEVKTSPSVIFNDKLLTGFQSKEKLSSLID